MTENLPPLWAARLARRVISDAGQRKPFTLEWRATPRRFSSGQAWPRARRIRIEAGTERADARMVLLHELAHLLCPEDAAHGPIFWKTAWRLYRRHRVPIRHALWSEGSYRAGAVRAAKKAGVRVSSELEAELARRRRGG